MTRLILVATLVIPWLSLFFMKKDSIKRYMPVTILTSLIMTIIFQIAYTYDWWTIHTYIVPWGYMIDVSFAYGIFLIGTLWIFYFTAQNFWLYIATNLAMDAIFAFVVLKFLLPWAHVATYVNIRAWQYWLVMFGVSLVIYGYHHWQMGIFRPSDNVQASKPERPVDAYALYRRRHKAR